MGTAEINKTHPTKYYEEMMEFVRKHRDRMLKVMSEIHRPSEEVFDRINEMLVANFSERYTQEIILSLQWLTDTLLSQSLKGTPVEQKILKRYGKIK